MLIYYIIFLQREEIVSFQVIIIVIKKSTEKTATKQMLVGFCLASVPGLMFDHVEAMQHISDQHLFL